MLIKDQHGSSKTGIGAGLLLGLSLVSGVALGLWLGVDYERGRADDDLARGPFSLDAPAIELLQPGEALRSLPELEIGIDAGGVSVLRAARARAMQEKIIQNRPGDTVAGEVRLGPVAHAARIRLKGDWTDHVDSDKWSLRIDLEGETILGMSRFSIQHPKTRGYLLEWLALAMARGEGILAPRSTFVRVSINGRPSGIYYLEEHFTKEMLESQGRREGPIVRFSEETLWTHWLQYGIAKGEAMPESVQFAATFDAAEISGFDESRLAATEALNSRLQRALAQMRDFQRLMLTSSSSRLEGLQALEDLQGRSIDELFDARKIGRWLALYCLINAAHGSNWMQWRFYHDPVLDRLEPIAFDTGAIMTGGNLASLLGSPQVREFMRSDACYEELFASLRRMTSEEYLQGLLELHGAEIARFGQALLEEGQTPLAATGLREFIFGLLKPAAADLAASIRPRVPAHFDCRLLPDPKGEGSGILEVEAWPITWTPLLIEDFEFSNGRRQTAASALPEESSELRRADGAALLARQGRRLRFRFPVDRRLSFLRSVQALKEGARAGRDVDHRVRLELKVRYRLVGSAEQQVEDLVIRRAVADDSQSGRPAAPSLQDALSQHPFLAYDLEKDRLWVRKGEWQVEGDLVVPKGYSLQATGGTTLQFAEAAVFSSETHLELIGSEAQPILLSAQENSGSWAGLMVHGADAESHLQHVILRSCAGIDRGAWQSPGGVTFYRSAVRISDSRFEDSKAEDALNVFATDMVLNRVFFLGASSDLFDGDFITGSIRDCEFRDSRGDAIDLSGSQLSIESCRMVGIGDKALSVGENSHVELRNCRIESAAIGLAAKDSSSLQVEGLQAGGIEHYLLAAYIKKSEFGPASITVAGLEYLAEGRPPSLVQTGCRIEVDGSSLAESEVDVDALYRRGILGK